MPCPGGSYFLETTGQCESCPVRTYQPQTAAAECRPCATAETRGMASCHAFGDELNTPPSQLQPNPLEPRDDIPPIDPIQEEM